MIFARPVNYKLPRVTGPYSTSHKGVDYGYPEGTPVFASSDGEVVSLVNDFDSNWTNTGRLTTRDYGNYIKIKHVNGYSTIYAHLKKDAFIIKAGQFVIRGQKIAESGNTGNSTGPHLHWELRKDEKSIDPFPLLDAGFTGYFIDQREEVTHSDDSKLDLGELGEMEKQAVISTILDLRRDNISLKEAREEQEILIQDLSEKTVELIKQLKELQVLHTDLANKHSLLLNEQRQSSVEELSIADLLTLVLQKAKAKFGI